MTLRSLWLALTLATSACGGASPLLHSAQPVAQGRITLGAGMSDRLLVGSAQTSLERARSVDAAPLAAADRSAYARGALIDVAEGPRVAPWIEARAGLGSGNDAGLAYTGRGVRLDGRHAFEWGQIALSTGAGVSLQGTAGAESNDNGRRVSASGITGLGTSGVNGIGFDVPVLVGYESDARLVSIWGGLRAGVELWRGDLTLHVDADPASERSAPFRAHRLYAGSVVGLMVGIEPFWVAAALEVSLARTSGHMDLSPGERSELAVTGLSLAPAGALIAEF